MKRDFGKRIRPRFSAEELEAKFAASEQRVSRARQRLVGAGAMAITLGAPVLDEANFEERLIDFGNLAEVGKERILQLRSEIDDLRKATGQSKGGVLDGIEAYVGKGMGLEEALAAMAATGRAAKATRSEMGQMANSGFAVMDNLEVAPNTLRKAFDIMAKTGKEGSFELAAMARKFPEITAGAKSLKMEGTDAVASLAAALQIAMKSAGSEDQAATNMTNFLGKITAPDTVRKFKKFGVDVEKEMSIALKRGADPLQHMLLVIREMTGGDAFKMGELFADKQVLDFLRAMIPNMEEYARIKNEALGADGVIDQDWEKVMKGAKEEWRQLVNAVSALTGASGSLLPVVTELMREIRGGVEWVNEWTQANPELTKTIVTGTAALLAFGAATRVLGFGFAVMQGGLLRTASLFLKFDKAGRNMSLFARGTRGAASALKLFNRGGRTARRLTGKPLKWAVTPLRWTKRLIPAIPWSSMSLGKFGMNAKGWGRVVTPLKWAAKGGLRLIPAIGWALLAADIGMFAWEVLGLKSLPWREYLDQTIDWAGWCFSFEWVDVLPKWRWLSIIGGPIVWGSMLAFKWADVLPTWDWRDIVPDFLLGGSSSNAPQPTSFSPVTDADRAELKSAISSLETQIASVKDGPMAAALKRPLQAELALLQADLSTALAPLTTAIEAGRSAVASPSMRSEQRSHEAPQPNVTVESTFASNPQLDVSVSVSMPVHITREQRIDNKAIAARAGEQVGAETERAIRRGLDDGANME